MIVNENEYNWSEWTQPIFTSNDSWGTVSASSVNTGGHEPFTAIDGNLNTQWESKANEVPTTFTWVFAKPLKITQIKQTNVTGLAVQCAALGLAGTLPDGCYQNTGQIICGH